MLPMSADDVQLDRVDPYFSRSSSLSVGAKGEELLDVSVEVRCGEVAWLFDHAEVVAQRNRFGDVQIVEMPKAGCEDCQPLKVRWYHEPTGYLDFSIRIWRQPKRLVCDSGEKPTNPLEIKQ